MCVFTGVYMSLGVLFVSITVLRNRGQHFLYFYWAAHNLEFSVALSEVYTHTHTQSTGPFRVGSVP